MKQLQYKAVKTVNVVIFTPIEVEFRAVANLLAKPVYLTDDETSQQYLIGHLRKSKSRLRIAICKGGKEAGNIATLTSKAIQFFNPNYVILFGTAAALNPKMALGDIIVADKAYSYESGRLLKDVVYYNPRVIKVESKFFNLAERLHRNEADWRAYLPEVQQRIPNIKIGAIASGDKVINSSNTDIIRYLQSACNDAKALEMEAYAFLQAAKAHPSTEALIIRGISDHLDNKDEVNALGSKELAVVNAGAFLKYVLEHVDKPRKTNLYANILIVTMIVLAGLMLKLKPGNRSKLASESNIKALKDSTESTIEMKVEKLPAEEITGISTPAIATHKNSVANKSVASDSIQTTFILDKPADLVNEEISLADSTTIIPIQQNTEKLYEISFTIFNKDDQLIHNGVFYIKNQAHSINSNLQLPAGNYELVLNYKHESFTYLLDVSATSDKQRYWYLD